MGWEKKTREDPPKPAGETRGYKGHMEGGEGGGFLGRRGKENDAGKATMIRILPVVYSWPVR